MNKRIKGTISLFVLMVFLQASMGVFVSYSKCNCTGKLTIQFFQTSKPDQGNNCCNGPMSGFQQEVSGQSCSLDKQKCCVGQDLYLYEDLEYTFNQKPRLDVLPQLFVQKPVLEILDEVTSGTSKKHFFKEPKPPGIGLVIVEYIHKTNPDEYSYHA